jgi:phage N-6-adenine-methyltransferase
MKAESRPTKAAPEISVAAGSDVHTTRQLDDLAAEVHHQYERGREAVVVAYEAQLAIGRALLEARELMPANQEFGQWFDAQEFGFSTQWAGVLRRAAENEPAVRAALETQVSDGGSPNLKDALRTVTAPALPPVEEGTQSTPTAEPEVWGDEAVEEPAGKAAPRIMHNSGDNEWYTPADIIEAARTALGVIDLDPASTATANEVVKAKEFYTAEDDGLTRPWQGRVWLNPPYAQPLIGQFVDKLVLEYDAGNVTEAIVLVNNCTETAWFSDLIDCAPHICFPKGRVRFWKPAGCPPGSPLQGQAIFYLGPEVRVFREVFEDFGPVLRLAS